MKNSRAIVITVVFVAFIVIIAFLRFAAPSFFHLGGLGL